MITLLQSILFFVLITLGAKANFEKLNTQFNALSDLPLSQEIYDSKGNPTTVEAGDLKAIYFDGLNYKGKKTRIFAWVGIPQTTTKSAKIPGIVLVHGGGGSAFKEWVQRWNKQGFAAISIAVEGQTDQKVPLETLDQKKSTWAQHQWAGPKRIGAYSDFNKPFTQQWMYHATASTILANSLLRKIDSVDENKVGIMGISWGGVITSTVIGIDQRFAFAIPTYGCGNMHLNENHYQKPLAKNEVYKQVYNPILRLEKAGMPTLWLTWLTDKHFGLNTQRACYHTSPAKYMVSIIPNLKHGHGAAWEKNESYEFAKSVVGTNEPWGQQISHKREKNKVTITMSSTKELNKATLLCTTDTGHTSQRKWHEKDVKLVKEGDKNWSISTNLPDGVTGYLFNFNSGGLTLSSDYQELKKN